MGALGTEPFFWERGLLSLPPQLEIPPRPVHLCYTRTELVLQFTYFARLLTIDRYPLWKMLWLVVKKWWSTKRSTKWK